MVVTRFAPSPTGTLHIGGARTALFNWLFARHAGGAFRVCALRTPTANCSTAEAVEAIFEGLRWLGLDWDVREPVSQSRRAARHREVAEGLLASGSGLSLLVHRRRTCANAGDGADQGRPGSLRRTLA